MGAAARYVERHWGQKSRDIENPLGVTNLTTNLQKILDNNPDRFSINIINLGLNDIYLGFDRQVSVSHGIRVLESGGFFALNIDEDGELVSRQLWGITAAGDSDIYVVIVEAE